MSRNLSQRSMLNNDIQVPLIAVNNNVYGAIQETKPPRQNRSQFNTGMTPVILMNVLRFFDHNLLTDEFIIEKEDGTKISEIIYKYLLSLRTTSKTFNDVICSNEMGVLLPIVASKMFAMQFRVVNLLRNLGAERVALSEAIGVDLSSMPLPIVDHNNQKRSIHLPTLRETLSFIKGIQCNDDKQFRNAMFQCLQENGEFYKTVMKKYFENQLELPGIVAELPEKVRALKSSRNNFNSAMQLLAVITLAFIVGLPIAGSDDDASRFCILSVGGGAVFCICLFFIGIFLKCSYFQAAGSICDKMDEVMHLHLAPSVIFWRQPEKEQVKGVEHHIEIPSDASDDKAVAGGGARAE